MSSPDAFKQGVQQLKHREKHQIEIIATQLNNIFDSTTTNDSPKEESTTAELKRLRAEHDPGRSSNERSLVDDVQAALPRFRQVRGPRNGNLTSVYEGNIV